MIADRPFRRSGLIFAAAVLLLVMGAAACRKSEEHAGATASAAPPPTARPRVSRDVVLITIDTLRYDATSFDGNPRGTTPNLDRFAAEGRVFRAAHSHNVITLPSHSNILTGMFPYQHGVRENAGFRLSPHTPTVATRLKARGYVTGAFVSAFVLDSRYGLNHDFDVYDELYRHLDEQLDFNIQQARAEDTVKAALEWFRAQASSGKPRFMWVHVYDPHAPYEPPSPYREQYKDDLYLGEVAYADAALAPLLAEVRADPTHPLLVVTGDHGEARGDHGELTHGLFCYEATLHIPLFIWGPGLVTSGEDTTPARHVDILPTILDAIGEAKPEELHGQSLLSARHTAGESYFEALSASFNRGWAPLRGLMDGGEKYIDLPIQELYDLPSDPAESKNLAPGTPDALRRLRKHLLELPNPTAERGTIGSDEAARLRSLGYLSGSSEKKASYGPADDPKTLIGVDQKIHQVIDLQEQKKFSEAEVIARQIVAENPKMRMGYIHLAVVQQAKGDQKGALKTYEAAVAHDAGGESLDRRRALLLSELGRPNDAVRVLEVYKESDDPETMNALGIALTDAGRAADALPVFARALEVDPSNSQAYQNTGIALLKLDRSEEARTNLEQALRLGKRHTRAWNALGVAWMNLDQPEKAIQAWERCVELNPDQFDALYNIGRVAGRLGDWKKARAALERFVANAPRNQYGKDIAEVRSALEDMKRHGV
jgi:arylsulfatase A-like enzyme/Tfp pilus assembly protein PilF